MATTTITPSIHLSGNEDKDWTPLHLASKCSTAEVVKALISEGADVNAQDKYGDTPLHEAALKGHLEVVKVLIQAGADVNARDERKITALHLAVKYGHLEVVQALIEAGADINAQDGEGWTLLHWAVMAKCPSTNIFEVLIAAGADVNARDNDENTPLDLTHCYDRDDAAQIFINAFESHLASLEEKELQSVIIEGEETAPKKAKRL